MNVHIALYKWKIGTSEASIHEALAEVEALADKIPGIVRIVTSENNSKHSEGYTHIILVKADSQSAINAYRAHPDHIKVAQTIDGMEEHGIGVDFETK